MDQKQFAFVLQHDVDTKKGRDKCQKLMELEMDLGFRSSFNFVPERYNGNLSLHEELVSKGFEVGVHGLKHDGKLFFSKRTFEKRAVKINKYIEAWSAVGFTSPSMHHKLDWMGALSIRYSTSTFDTDPFEPQPDGVSTIFPFWVQCRPKGFVEMPYTLPQDFTLFILLKEKNIEIWKKKLDWIAEKGGMALINTHPDYMSFEEKRSMGEYPAEFYKEFLEYVKTKYGGLYWHALPGEVAQFWEANMRC